MLDEWDAALRAVIEAAVCWWCGHMAGDHFGHVGPCAECWRLLRAANGDRQMCGKTLCERMVPGPETARALEAVPTRHGVTA